MSIASELSCDVATAILSREGADAEPASGGLTDVVREFHTTLRQLTAEARRIRRTQLLTPKAQAATAQASTPADGGDVPSVGH